MSIIIPQNIYSTLFALSLPDNEKGKIVIKESSLIIKELEANKEAIGIIPSLDLLRHPEIFVSKNFAISFDGILSNSYLYFQPEQNSLNRVLLRGDISSNDLILSKILFPEQYGIEPEFALDAKQIDLDSNNYLMVGMENNLYPITNNGISFSDHIADLIDLPYVNFVLASYSEARLEQFSEVLENSVELINTNFQEYLAKLKLDTKFNDFIINNINSVYFDFTENEKIALEELLKLPYYHGITEELVEVNFVGSEN